MAVGPIIPFAEKNHDINLAERSEPGIVIPKNIKSALPAYTPGPNPAAKAIDAAMQTLGLPKDQLSAAILVFSRVFSAAPEPAFLSLLRKEVLASAKSSPKTRAEKDQMESKVLAALAAADKNAVLEKDELEIYSMFPFGNENKNDDDDQKKRDLLHSLNKIPGKNGQKWIVWPFKYFSDDSELRVCVRLLIKDEEGIIIADIFDQKKNWRFLVNKSGKKTSVEISIVPGLSKNEERKLRKAAEKQLKADNIRIGSEELSLTEALSEALPYVNEEV